MQCFLTTPLGYNRVMDSADTGREIANGIMVASSAIIVKVKLPSEILPAMSKRWAMMHGLTRN